MVALVRIALRRPYTFVVLALLILIIGPLAAIRTPVDIFPEIRIPIIAAIWQYTGLQPDHMAGRMVTQYQRVLTTTVNDIEHIEATSYNGLGIVKVFFQPGADIRIANAQVTAVSQTVLKNMPPGTTPPLILNYNASTVPIIQLALSGKGMSEQRLADLGLNILRVGLITVPGAAIPYPYGGKPRQVQIDLDSAAMQARGLSGQDVANALAAQNLITPVGTEKIGNFEYAIQLNNAPSLIAALGDLPIKTVNGAMVYIHDVAQVRDGNPPQTNIVHVEGNRSVLMQVLKNGAVSTLAIIDGIKKKVQEMKAVLPDNLDIAQIGDQSIFINAAIGGVIREGVIAAALTSVMILLFLGSVRSTLIIATSIPLSVLGSIATLWALGETLNIMTLGGLALAVGILVDEATVTIENINWHLEQGKEVETAIMDGAAQIVVPAFVSMLCICIVFVPMFFLTGVSRFLFVPMAEAVMSAMVWSFILSRTLVPTMANYLLRKHAPHTDLHGLDIAPPPSRNPLVRLQRGFEAGFERFRAAYRELLAWRCMHRTMFVTCFLAVCGRLVRAGALSRPRLLSVGRCRSDLDACAHPRRHPRRRKRAAICRNREGDPPNHSAERTRDAGRQYRLSGQRHQHDLQQHRHHRDAGRRNPDQAERRPPADARICSRDARGTAGAVPGHDLLVPAGRHHQPNPEFRRAGADRLANPRPRSRDRLRLCGDPAAAASPRARPWSMRAFSNRSSGPELRCRCRSHARAICRHHRTRRDQQHGRQSRRQQPGRADLLAQSRQRRQLRDRDADAAISDRLAERAEESADHRAGRAVADARRHRRHQARRRRRRSIRNTTSSRWSRSTAPRRAAISAPSPPTSRRSSTTAPRSLPKGVQVVLLGQVRP